MTDTRWFVPDTVVVEVLEDGTVLYDTSNDTVLCLTGPATEIIAAAQRATVAEIADATGVSEAETAAFLTELHDKGLVKPEQTEARLARRSLVTLASGAAVTLGVWSIVAPTPAAAQSGATT